MSRENRIREEEEEGSMFDQPFDFYSLLAHMRIIKM
jgi:hypothetical protein